MASPCPPIPDFLIRRGDVPITHSLPVGHPVHDAAIAQRRRKEQQQQHPRLSPLSATKAEWTVYRVAISGARTRLGKITAPHEIAAIKAAQRKWPNEVDTTRPQGGLAVERKP